MILFIDDEHRRITPYIEELQFSDYKVEFQDNINDALNFYKNNQENIDLIVLDIMMPMGDNFEKSDMEKSEFGLNTGVYFYKKYLKGKIPVILFTHKSDAELPDDCKDNPAYLLKKIDYTPDELAKKIKSIIDKNNSIMKEGNS